VRSMQRPLLRRNLSRIFAIPTPPCIAVLVIVSIRPSDYLKKFRIGLVFVVVDRLRSLNIVTKIGGRPKRKPDTIPRPLYQFHSHNSMLFRST
jgi:hypothetical protein